MELTTEQRTMLEDIRTRLGSMTRASASTLDQLDDEFVSIMGPNAPSGTVYLFYSKHLSLLRTLQTGNARNKKKAVGSFEDIRRFGLDKLAILLDKKLA